MKFLLNMNVSRAVGDELTRLGQEWDHARNLGLATADDRQIVALAQRESRVIVTHDLTMVTC